MDGLEELATTRLSDGPSDELRLCLVACTIRCMNG